MELKMTARDMALLQKSPVTGLSLEFTIVEAELKFRQEWNAENGVGAQDVHLRRPRRILNKSYRLVQE